MRALALALLLAPAPAVAQTGPDPNRAALDACWAAGNGTDCTGLMSGPCMEADPTTVGMVQCLVDEVDWWRAQSARLVAELRKRAAQADAAPPDPALPIRPSSVAALTRLVAAWDQLIEARCDYEVIPFLAGTLRGPLGVSCRLNGAAELTGYLARMLASEDSL